MATHWREKIWSSLELPWDLVVVGGGITGAGIALEAARRRLRVLLLEQGDFASGTSSRSSKLVHGGLRYLAQGNLKLSYQSVRERDQLLGELPGLVEPIGFLVASYTGDKVGRRSVGLALRLYDLFGQGAPHKSLTISDLTMQAPKLRLENLLGGFWYRDASTDDARLVLRTLAEAEAAGAVTLNRARVEELVHKNGVVAGVAVRDLETGRVVKVPALAVVNATGAWADRLRAHVDGKAAIRPLRGSHLLFPRWRFPVAQAVAFVSPRDHRPLFAYPWEGLTLLGTTDRDHSGALDEEPVMTSDEASYLVEAARAAFPGLELSVGDALSSYSGVRPVIGTGKADPSKESRESVVWNERGLVTVTGGKLTTFHAVARSALKAVEKHVPALKRQLDQGHRYTPPPPTPAAPIDWLDRRRVEGRYGAAAAGLLEAARPGELDRIPETYFLWAELRWAARAEKVVHLDDLLLRRVRVGLLLPEGGREHLPRVRAICQAELGWDDNRWAEEEARYLDAWPRHHGPPRGAPSPAMAPRASAPRPLVSKAVPAM